jgi:hypothetical protein
MDDEVIPKVRRDLSSVAKRFFPFRHSGVARVVYGRNPESSLFFFNTKNWIPGSIAMKPAMAPE